MQFSASTIGNSHLGFGDIWIGGLIFVGSPHLQWKAVTGRPVMGLLLTSACMVSLGGGLVCVNAYWLLDSNANMHIQYCIVDSDVMFIPFQTL